MTETALAALIFSLCAQYTGDTKQMCFESYVNCAIEDEIMSKTDFDKHCKSKINPKEQTNE